MAQERIRFKGDPEVQETGSGAAPQIPLNKNVQATSVEMLNDEDDVDNGDDEAGPSYRRERLGARIGLPLEEASKVEEVEQELDTSDVVQCMFPKPVKLQHAGLWHEFGAGVHLVPTALAGRTKDDMHWWLKRNKVRRMGKPMPKPEPETEDSAA